MLTMGGDDSPIIPWMRFPKRSRPAAVLGSCVGGGIAEWWCGFRSQRTRVLPPVPPPTTTAIRTRRHQQQQQQQLLALPALLLLSCLLVVTMHSSGGSSTLPGGVVRVAVHAWTTTTTTSIRCASSSLGRHRQDGGATVSSSSLFLSDRFIAECPAPLASIRQFAPSLVPPAAVATQNDGDNGDSDNSKEVDGLEKEPKDADVWVAVYRSNQNQPSVLMVRDEFLHSMRSATEQPMVVSVVASSSSLLVRGGPAATTIPVAIGRLRLQTKQQQSSVAKSNTISNNNDNDDDCTATFLMDSLRCILKKETTDAACDGGSEHTEALAVAMDTLVLHYLQQQQQSQPRFHGCLRVKGTLVSGPLLEDRGFDPVPALEVDLATHTSSLDGCLRQYAARAVTTTTHSSCGPQARQRAMEIVLRLGRLDRQADLLAAAAAKLRQQQQQRAATHPDDDTDDEVDPWAGMKRLL